MYKKLIFFSLFFIFLSCALNPVTGKRQLMLLSKEDEISIGKKTDLEIIETYGIYEDPILSNYISNIGIEISKVSHQPDLPYNFKVLDSPVINAFAVPGGYVYVTREILAHINDEAELAGVLGHEIGHITARHTAQLYSKAILAQFGIALGAALSEKFKKYAGIMEIGLGILFLSFSRENERQADELAVLYSSKAGYDANQMANLFIKLEMLNPSSGSDGLPSWLSTHPDPPDRIKAIGEHVKKWKEKNPDFAGRIGREDYLKKIDGIIVGDDPRNGYVENHVFYHPKLKIEFLIPYGWKYLKTHSQIRIFPPSQDAIMVFSCTKENSLNEAEKNFVSSNKLLILKKEEKFVNNFNVKSLNFKAETEKINYLGIANFIKAEQKIISFIAYTEENKFSKYSNEFLRTFNNLRSIDKNKINVFPERIKIFHVEREDKFENILKDLGYSGDYRKKISILNGIGLDDFLKKGNLIKIIKK